MHASNSQRTLGFLLATVLTATSHVCVAASISYVITDCSDPAHPSEIAHGTKTYSPDDVEVIARGGDKHPFLLKSIDLADGFQIGASVFSEKTIDGFGLWAELTGLRAVWHGRGFSWEWFYQPVDGVFRKLQEGGRVRVTFREVQGLKEIAMITFESDVSLRINNTGEVGAVTHRVLVKKGSVLEFPP